MKSVSAHQIHSGQRQDGI